MKEKLSPMLTGAAIGLGALLLTFFGNPPNMGFCVACFLRDSAGALGLHQTENLQYFRPEILGLILGALLLSLCTKEFRPRGGSSPMTRLILGMLVMLGGLVFLGCPLRMLLRLGGGDGNALVGFVGFTAGIGAGAFFLNRGFTLKRAYPQTKTEGLAFPILMTVFFVLCLFRPAQGKAAPRILALGVALVLGAMCQRSRFCMAGGIRDAMLFRDFRLLTGAAALLVTVTLGNLLLGNFHPGFADQPVAHGESLWNFLGMAVVGWGSVLLGGCPLRQLILAGQGDSDAGLTVVGMVLGGALCHTLNLASSPKGTTPGGRIGVLLALAILSALSILHTKEAKA